MQQASVGGKPEAPDTKLCELLAIFQDLFHKYPDFQLLEPVHVLAKILDEPGNHGEILRFIDSYILDGGGIIPSFEGTRKGMAVMAILGYMYAKGEYKTKGIIL